MTKLRLRDAKRLVQVQAADTRWGQKRKRSRLAAGPVCVAIILLGSLAVNTRMGNRLNLWVKGKKIFFLLQ